MTTGGPRNAEEFTDRIAVVSGGASGIGLAIADALDARGCRVAVLDIIVNATPARGPRPSSCEESPASNPAAAIAPSVMSAIDSGRAGNALHGASSDSVHGLRGLDVGGDATLLRRRFELVDVSDSHAVEAAIARIEAEWGPIDYGVSVAGILATGPLVETNDETWARVMSVNASGVFHLHRALARRMMPRRRGSLVTVSSNAAGIPRHGMAAYAASKAAATMMTKCLGLELAASGIRVNVVSPGSTRTPMQEAMWASGSSEEIVLRGSLETYRSGIPLGKIAEPHEVAEAVLFLLSERASHITMADLYVDGGATPR
jgi:2,3-dihydro-2,3-dihydroxybenzoate dehydrogenase